MGPRLRTSARALSAALLLALAADPTAAEPPAARSAEAAALFDQGMKAFQAREFEAAIHAFEAKAKASLFEVR